MSSPIKDDNHKLGLVFSVKIPIIKIVLERAVKDKPPVSALCP